MAFGSSQFDTGSGVGLGLRALGFAPGPIGLVGTLASLGLRGNNLGYANRARASWGQGNLDFGQSIGGLLGLNSYSAGGGRDKLGEFNGVDVTPSGMSSRGGFLGIGAEPVGAYTPGEAQRHYAASVYGNSFGTPRVGPVAPAQTAAPVQAAPVTERRPVYSKAAFDMGAYNADPDPIGAMVRGFGASVNGGGRSGGGGGGGYGGYGGGGRSDRSTMSSGRG